MLIERLLIKLTMKSIRRDSPGPRSSRRSVQQTQSFRKLAVIYEALDCPDRFAERSDSQTDLLPRKPLRKPCSIIDDDSNLPNSFHTSIQSNPKVAKAG